MAATAQSAIAVIGIDIGKNSFHVVGLDGRGAIVLRLRVLFVQAAWVVLVKVKPIRWEGHGLRPWIEAAKKRLHHNVLAIALANKLARIAWSVLVHGRAFETNKRQAAA